MAYHPDVNVPKLPPVDVLASMSAVERDILLARVKAASKRKKARAIETALGLPDVADWIEAHCYDADRVRNPEFPQGAPKIVLEEFQKRILRHCFTINPKTGRFPYRTVVYSAPKKSGKSAIGGCITAYFAACVEVPNAVYVLANDREQSSGRVFKAAKPTLYGLGAKKDGRWTLALPNGSYVVASTSDPDKEAGGSYGLTVWDELWAYTTERANLLWDELRPIPTRTNSMRLVVTYAGFENSSDLLYKLYTSIFVDSTETRFQPGARPVPGLEDITTTDANGEPIPVCWEHPESGMFYMNDHEQRMRWQTGEHGEALLREITATESKETNTYRLTYNRWQKTEDRFITPAELNISFNLSGLSGAPDTATGQTQIYRLGTEFYAPPHLTKPLTLGVDAGWMKDSSGFVGVFKYKDTFVTDEVRTWYPSSDAHGGRLGLDLRATIFNSILELVRAGRVARRLPEPHERRIVDEERLVCYDIWYDDTQLHQLFMDLRKEYKILGCKFDQKRRRLLADSFLRDQYQQFKIDNRPSKDLYSHIDAASVEAQIDADNVLYRIVKGTGKNAKPIDLTVAQSMAVYQCSLRPTIATFSQVVHGKAKGWVPK